MISQDNMRTILRHRCDQAGGQKAFAESIGVSPTWLNDVLGGRKEVSGNLAEKLGYERRVLFFSCNSPKGEA